MIKEKDLEVGKMYDLNVWNGVYPAIFVKRDDTSIRFFPIDKSQIAFCINKKDGLIGFSFAIEASEQLDFKLLDTNDMLCDMITTDIHNLWLDAPKVVQDILEKYMEDFRFHEFVALEEERERKQHDDVYEEKEKRREENDLHDLESERQDN